MAAALLLALPNLFGDEPAIQLARDDRAAMDAAAQQRVQGVLEEQKIPPTASYLEEGRLVLRFAHVDDQIRARDAINEATQGEYIVALTSVPRTPALLRALGLKPMSLGLDLRGGVHFMYEVDVEGAVDQALQRLAQDIRTQLRDERIPYTDACVEGQHGARDACAPARMSAAARKAHSGATIRASRITQRDGRRTDRRSTVALHAASGSSSARISRSSRTSPRCAIASTSSACPSRSWRARALDRIVVQLPGVQDPNQAVRVLGATATVEFRLVDEANNPYEAESTKRVPIGSKLYRTRDGRPDPAEARHHRDRRAADGCDFAASRKARRKST